MDREKEGEGEGEGESVLARETSAQTQHAAQVTYVYGKRDPYAARETSR